MQNHSAPSEITNSPVIGLGSPVVQQSPKISQSKSRARIKRKDVENDLKHSSPSKTRRSSNQNESPNLTVFDSISLPMSRDDTIRQCPVPLLPASSTITSPTATALKAPTSAFPSPNIYAGGAALVRCPSSETMASRRRSSYRMSIGTGDRVTSISGQPSPVGRRSPVSKSSAFLSSADGHAGHGKWSGNVLGLGLPTVGLGVPFGRDEQVTNSAGSHLELSRTFDLDIDVHGDDSIAVQADIPSTSISGLPHSTVPGWPSPFLAWNPAPPVSEVPQLSSFGLAVPLSPPVATQSPNISDVTLPVPPSTASRWLEIYHSHPSSPQVQVSEVTGLGLGLTTAMSPESSDLPLSRAFDIQHGRQQAFHSKHISGLPHSSISQ
jgi:hypothetical protein